MPSTSSSKPVRDERVKSSLVLQRSHIVIGQRIAREIGLSWNAYVNLAVLNQNRLYASTGGVPYPGPIVPASVQALDVGTLTTEVGKRAILTKPDGSVVAATGRPVNRRGRVSPVGEGFTLPGDSPEETYYAPWEVVEQYATRQRKHPTADPLRMARLLKIDPAVARAADAGQASPEFERWMRWRYNVKTMPTSSRLASRKRR